MQRTLIMPSSFRQHAVRMLTRCARASALQRRMSLLPPASVSLVGSVARGTALAPDVVADVAIEMPAACFEGKDHINHRFHVKRAVYISAVAAHLKSRDFKRLTWVVLNHDPRSVLLPFASIFLG